MTTLDKSVYDDVQAYKQQLEQETTSKSSGEVEPQPNRLTFRSRTNRAGVPLQPDVIVNKTQTDDGHCDASSIATSEQQMKLTSSTIFQDQQQQQRECDDTKLERVSEWKDGDDTVTTTESPTVTSSQPQLESTTIGWLEVNNNPHGETKEKYEETKYRQEEQLGHCQPCTEAAVEKQARESDSQHNALVDEISSQEQSQEEHEEQSRRASTEQQSSEDTGTGQERDELVIEKVEEMKNREEEQLGHYYRRSDETTLEEQQSQESNSPEYVQHHVLVDVRHPDTSQEQLEEMIQEHEEQSRRTSTEEQSSKETGDVGYEMLRQQVAAAEVDISGDVTAVGDCTTEDSIQHTVHTHDNWHKQELQLSDVAAEDGDD